MDTGTGRSASEEEVHVVSLGVYPLDFLDGVTMPFGNSATFLISELFGLQSVLRDGKRRDGIWE